METEHHHPHDTDYADSQWVEMGGYHAAGPHSNVTSLHEYAGYGYGSPAIMPIEPAYTMSRPPPYTPHQQLQPLHPLVMPPWPSMLTTQPTSYSTPPMPTAPISTPVSASTTHSAHSVQVTPTTTGGSTPRRTLTDDDRRRMCQYREDHPNVKQTEIGAMFGVERSTVSKVLRQKEKFLYPNDGSQSPIKKTKGKFPDIERALANWARNEQRKGTPLTDAKIREQARFFATTVGSNESQSKLTSSAWLEKFKMKNNLLGAKLRKGSIDIIHDLDKVAVAELSSTSSSQTPTGYSPVSSGTLTPPLSPGQCDEVTQGGASDSFFDLGSKYGNMDSDRATSLASGYSGDSMPALASATMSPDSPMLADSSSGSGPFTPSSHARLPPLASNFSRPRSQTFPTLDTEPAVPTKQSTTDQKASAFRDQSSSSCLVDSPVDDESLLVDPLETMKRNHSVPDIKSMRAASMQPPPLPKSENISPISSPGSPTQDDARRALDLVMTFFQIQQPGILEPDEYATIGKLMVKLKLASPTGTPVLPGGLHRIDEHDSPRMAKKRSMLGIYAV